MMSTPSPWLWLRLISIMMLMISLKGVMSDTNLCYIIIMVIRPDSCNTNSTILLDYIEIGIDTTGLKSIRVHLSTLLIAVTYSFLTQFQYYRYLIR